MTTVIEQACQMLLENREVYIVEIGGDIKVFPGTVSPCTFDGCGLMLRVEKLPSCKAHVSAVGASTVTDRDLCRLVGRDRGCQCPLARAVGTVVIAKNVIR